MKLISMTDFVLNGQETADYIKLYYGCFRYAVFLKQPLTIGMFTPCDENGKILEDPQIIKSTFNVASGSGGFFDSKSFVSYIVKYEKAKENVLFVGLKIIDKGNFYFIEKEDSCLYFRILKISEGTVEFLLKNGWDIILTDNAIKQLGL